MSKVTAAVSVVAISLVAAAPAVADPTPFATESTTCNGYGTLTFPPQSAAHPNVIVSLTSAGASGNSLTTDYGAYYSFSPGDKVWGTGSPVDAGTSPTFGYDCTGGSIQVSLYDRPSAPTSFSGLSSGPNTSASYDFTTLGSGQFIADVTISQGAISISGSGTASGQTIASSGQYPLGSLSAGSNYLEVDGVSGPTADYSISISELPVEISNLSFGSVQYAAAGNILTGSFSVSGDTTISAYVRNATGQVARNLGSFAVSEGNSSITWDTRGANGAVLPDGLYYLHLDSTDPNGNVSSAEAPITVDNTPPVVEMTSPTTITPSQSVSFAVSDAESGVGSVSLFIDGQDVEDFGGYSGNPVQPTFSYANYGATWSLGTHTWEIQATDNVGNATDQTGTFTAAASSPSRSPSPTPTLRTPTPKVTGAGATRAFGQWLKIHYGNGLTEYWTCPGSQIYNKTASCLAEFRTGQRWHQVFADVKIMGTVLAVRDVHAVSWWRKWSSYSHRYLRGFDTPGRAQVNSPYFDWAFMGGYLYYEYQRHRQAFAAFDYDGNGGTGYGRVYQFRCRTRAKTIQCANAFGDSMKYRP